MYSIVIFPNTIAPWFSQVYAGLYELSDTGSVDVTISPRVVHRDLVDATSLALEVTDHDSARTLRILIDLDDTKRFAFPHLIDQFDVIAKRSFFRPEIEKLPRAQQRKIIPYGINFNCGSPSIPVGRLFLNHHLLRLRLGLLKSKQSQRFLFQHQLRFLFFLANNDLSLNEADFINSPDSPTRHDIFFVTRMFGTQQGLTEFSQRRIELMQALRKTFGPRFHGGIVRTRLSERFCPKELLRPKMSRRKFAETLGASNVVVSTLGVGGSNPWKLGEFIAAARCIVSEPLVFELPIPLEERKHICSFTSTDHCLETCDALLSNDSLVNDMKHHAESYFLNHVTASRLILSLLTRAFAAC